MPAGACEMAKASGEPNYLLCYRESTDGEVFRQRVRGIAIREVLTAPRSPVQNPYVERLDHLIVLNEKPLL